MRAPLITFFCHVSYIYNPLLIFFGDNMSVSESMLLESLCDEVGVSKKPSAKKPVSENQLESIDKEIENVFIDLEIEKAKTNNVHSKYDAITSQLEMQMVNESILGNSKSETRLVFKLQQYEDLLQEYPHICLKERTTEEGALISSAHSEEQREKYENMAPEEYIDTLLEHKYRHMRYGSL